MNYWQIAAGSKGRDYAEDFLRFGMAFVGGKVQLRTMDTVAAGDRVILKRGMSEIVAVGEVVEKDGQHRGCGDKEWLRDFDGWDLQAYCHVSWHRPTRPVKTRGLVRATIQKVHQRKLKDIADRLIVDAPKIAKRDPEPEPTREVADEEILEFLIVQGLRPGAAEDLTQAMNRIRRLAKYYSDNVDWAEVREHETRTFMVVPLLMALGWAEQQLKIELPVSNVGRVDIAGFRRPFAGTRKTDECVLLIETKGFAQGLDYAPDQAKKYAKHFPHCQVILVSNGYCYKAYRRDGKGGFSTTPTAYLNLFKPRDRYPLDPENVDGCLEALRLLLPSSLA